MLIAGIVALIFGLGFFFIPGQVLSLYGDKPDVLAQFLARYFGSALLGVGVLLLAVRKSKTREDAIKGGTLGLLVLSIAGLIVSIWDMIAGVSNDLLWLNIVVYGLLGIGFGYFYFKK
jgi:hypothetical protein